MKASQRLSLIQTTDAAMGSPKMPACAATTCTCFVEFSCEVVASDYAGVTAQARTSSQA